MESLSWGVQKPRTLRSRAPSKIFAPFSEPAPRTNPFRKARRGAWHASRMEKLIAAASLNQVFHLWDPRIQNLLSQVKSTPDAEAISTRKRHWRETLRYRRKEVSLAQLHDRAATVGITPAHRQRPAHSDFEWPDPVPARTETNLPALEGPPIKQKWKMIVESPESEEAEEESAADQPPDQPSDLLVEDIPADSSLIPMQPARPAVLQIMGPQDPSPQTDLKDHMSSGRNARCSLSNVPEGRRV